MLGGEQWRAAAEPGEEDEGDSGGTSAESISRPLRGR